MPDAIGRVDDAANAPPRVPAGMIARPRLVTQLNEAWDALVITGPAGAGKTVLVAQWAAEQAEPVRWVDAALLERVTEASQPGSPTTTVIDHAEILGADEFRALGSLLDTTSDRLVLLSRSPDTAQRLVATTNQTIARIGTDQLLVDDDELTRLLPDHDESARRMVAIEAGRLIVGIRDAQELHSGLLAERFRQRVVGDFAERPDGYRRSVALLAAIESVDADLGEQIGVPESHLRLAIQDGLVTTNDVWWDMTAFAARALEPLTVELEPAELERVRRLALRTPSLRRARPYTALRLAVALRDFDEATRVVMEHGLAITDEPDQARRALAGVGYRDAKQHPILVAILAQLAYLQRSTRLHGMVLYGRAAAGLRAGISKATPIEAAWFRVFVATITRATPLADRALPRTRRAFAELEQLDTDGRSLSVVGGQLMTHAGITGFLGGDDEFAAAMYERAYGILRDLDSHEQVDPLSLYAMLAAYRGDLPLARELSDTAQAAAWPSGWRTGLRGQALALALAVLALESGDDEEASRQLVMTGPIEDLIEHWSTFATMRAWRDLFAGEHQRGIARLRATRAHRSRAPLTAVSRARLDAAEALLLISVGESGAALPLATEAARHAPEGALELARAQLALGRIGEAGATLTRVAAADPAPRVTLGADLLAATIAYRGDDQPAGDLRLLMAAERHATTGLQLPFLPLIDTDRDLLASHAHRLGLPEFAAQLARFRPARPPIDVRVPQLTVREQKVLDALADGESNAQIAARLYVSPNTVKTQLRSLYRKLGADSREQAVARAAALGLISGAALGDEREDRLA